jgi:phosphoribosylformylglycinamidine synthase
LGQLKRACEGVYDLSVAYLAPLISGKDSMFNDFKGFDEKGSEIKISIPPTLLISSIGIVENVDKAVTIDAKFAGDLIYILGETFDEMGGSEYFSKLGYQGGKVPATDPKKNLNIYQQYAKVVDKGLVSSGIGINRGGLGVALSKMAIAGKLGVNVDLKKIVGKVNLDQEVLFSESTGRILLTIDPKNKLKFESIMKDISFSLIGEVSQIDAIKIKGLDAKEIVSIKVEDVLDSYKKRFKDW